MITDLERERERERGPGGSGTVKLRGFGGFGFGFGFGCGCLCCLFCGGENFEESRRKFALARFIIYMFTFLLCLIELLSVCIINPTRVKRRV